MANMTYGVSAEGSGEDLEDSIVEVFRAAIRTVRMRQIKSAKIHFSITPSGEFYAGSQDDIPASVYRERIIAGYHMHGVNDGDPLKQINLDGQDNG